jgi:hypothetical protein
MRTELKYADSTVPNAEQINVQTEYLRGALFSDIEHLDPALIDPYGTGNRDFWRGFIEAVGNVAIYPKLPPYIPPQGPTYPHVDFKANYAVLSKFLAFLQEEIHTRQGIQWKWDDDGKLEAKAQREGDFCVNSQKAQDVVRVLYMNCSVSKESCREAADRIIQWLPKR